MPEADKIVPTVNKYIRLFEKKSLPIFITRDWHPENSRHFKQYGGLWPIHCVQGAKGARFHPKLKIPKSAIILSKGTGLKEDGYSDFKSRDQNGANLKSMLRNLWVKELYAGGLATDYCVKYTVLDGLRFGFKVRLLMDAVKGVNLKLGDSRKAIARMLRCGAKKTNYSQARKSLKGK